MRISEINAFFSAILLRIV